MQALSYLYTQGKTALHENLQIIWSHYPFINCSIRRRITNLLDDHFCEARVELLQGIGWMESVDQQMIIKRGRAANFPSFPFKSWEMREFDLGDDDDNGCFNGNDADDEESTMIVMMICWEESLQKCCIPHLSTAQ